MILRFNLLIFYTVKNNIDGKLLKDLNQLNELYISKEQNLPLILKQIYKHFFVLKSREISLF